jgi:cold-inducible RNA-binding protein
MKTSFDSQADLGIVSHRPVRPSLFDPARFAHLQLQKESEKQMKNIFVGNLSFGTTEVELRSMFESYGAVERASIVTDRDSGQPRGFAFVEMTNDAEANSAINGLNGKDLGGRTLNVNEARPKTAGAGGGGGGQRRDKRW